MLRIVALVVANPPCSKRLATPANLPALVALLVGDGAATRREAARTILTLVETPVNRAKLIDAGCRRSCSSEGRRTSYCGS